MNDTIDQTTALQVAEPRDTAVMPGFNSNGSWELAQRIGKAFAASSLVPQQYQGNLANCIVALEMANRMGASPLMVMQNLYIVHGNPGWSSKFLIASFNQCGRFSSLRYDWHTDRSGCRAWAIEKATGERIEGPTVTLQMAKDEGWSTKSGSKWRTMPELMLMYRAAAFLIRTYAPEISMGLRTDDEIIDTVEPVRESTSVDAVRQVLGVAKPAAIANTPQPTLGDRIASAADLQTLQALGEEMDTLPDSTEKEELAQALLARENAITG
jgi:hypothetical protein